MAWISGVSGRVLIWLLVVTTFMTGLIPADVSAGVLSPETLVSTNLADRDAALAKIRAVLDKKIVQQRLADLGLKADEIEARLAQLTDAQMQQLATQVDSIMAGGDGLGVVVFLLVIAILVVILLQLTGHKIIITK